MNRLLKLNSVCLDLITPAICFTDANKHLLKIFNSLLHQCGYFPHIAPDDGANLRDEASLNEE